MACSRSLLAFGPADDFWNTEPPDKWTPDQIQELTSKSPWARPVTAQVKGNSPLSNAGTGRGGRRSMGTTTTGRGAGASSGSDSPKFNGVVRWASAKPIRLALKLQFPPSLADHFVISVSDLPIVSGHGSEDSSSGGAADSYDGLKAQTSLQVKGQEAIQPGVIEPDKNETSTLYFGFLPQLVQLEGDKTVTFATTMSPLSVKVKFELKQMKFQGELAI
jgi:hypothetical protein